jgi:UDP-N-acetylglucosamine 4,6-dehydratase/5-epimerase
MFTNKTILITGGTGSLGQKLVRFFLEHSKVRKIIIFSRDELKQSQMQTQIEDKDQRLRFFIGDVRDLERLQRAFKGVDYVIHAAALKQVPALEYNPFEAVKTNILGTQNVISAALDQKVEKVLLVSTDKAANPANLYGATKLCAERLVISSNSYSGIGGTKLSAVRYGNVVGSRGSIVKIIEEQRASGVITLTHKDMTRFWITLDQAVDLVVMALNKMFGGEIFIPKIPSMKMKDFLTALAPECKIKVIGIRPGEKLHEVLLTKEESRHSLEFAKHFVILPEHVKQFDSEERFAGLYKTGKGLSSGFEFASNTNTKWLNNKEFQALVGIVKKDTIKI